MKLKNLLRNLSISLVLPFTLSAYAAEMPEADRSHWDNTFSIVARDPATGAVGGAVSTARLSVGNRVLQMEFGLGAAASQANTNTVLARDALDHLRKGSTAKEPRPLSLGPSPTTSRATSSARTWWSQAISWSGAKPLRPW
jgi:hypothetical protein